MKKAKATSNLMAPPLLGSGSTGADHNSRMQYNSLPTKLPSNDDVAAARIRTVDEAAHAVRERLPGRSKKAKDQFRRQQRGEKGDQWRGRLSGYCPSDSLDCEKLTKHLKASVAALTDNGTAPQHTSLLYTRKWRVKPYFDVLHLHSNAPKTPASAAIAMAQQDSGDESFFESNAARRRDAGGCECFFQVFSGQTLTLLFNSGIWLL